MIVGILLEPVVSFMVRHRIPRWLATLVVLVVVVAVVAGLATVVVYGVSTQAGAINAQVQKAADRIQDWMDNLKVSGGFARWVQEEVEKAWPRSPTAWPTSWRGACTASPPSW